MTLCGPDLLLAVTVGVWTFCAPWDGPGGLTWEVESRGFVQGGVEGSSQQFVTPENTLEVTWLEVLRQHRARARSSRREDAPWSEWSRWYPVLPVVEWDGDGYVGNREFLVLRALFGRQLTWDEGRGQGVYTQPGVLP